MTLDSDEIQDHIQEEKSRGKRPVNISAKRRRLLLLKKFREALLNNDVEQFKEAIIHDLGQLPGTPEYQNSLKIWNKYHGSS